MDENSGCLSTLLPLGFLIVVWSIAYMLDIHPNGHRSEPTTLIRERQPYAFEQTP